MAPFLEIVQLTAGAGPAGLQAATDTLIAGAHGCKACKTQRQVVGRFECTGCFQTMAKKMRPAAGRRLTFLFFGLAAV